MYGHYGHYSSGVSGMVPSGHRAQLVWATWAHNVAAWEVQHRPDGVCTGEGARAMYAWLSVASGSYTSLYALLQVTMS